MSQLATIFEKIKEDFFESLTLNENKEQFKLIFAPFSTGFTNDDFLFLDTNNASAHVHKYLDELYEFSQIASTIPKQDNFWVTSDNSNDYLFNKYKTIIQSLRLIDVDTLTINMLYGHPIFDQALAAVDPDMAKSYKAFYDLQQSLKKEIEDLKNETINDATQQLQIDIKTQNLKTVEEQWTNDAHKTSVETKILDILKDEIKRFIQKLTATKANFETAIRTHLASGTDFYLTYCMPNNLYKKEGLNLKKIKITQADINRLAKKESTKEYKSLFGEANEMLEIEHIAFELIFVDVTRSWFEDSILESPFWDINILNKDDIEIPNVTNKLILIKNIDIKLKENSKKNAQFLKLKTPKNLGPFVVNPQLLKSGKPLQLKSVNMALNLKRETILNVASKINAKPKTNTQNLVLKKQKQFVTLAPKLQERKIVASKLEKSKSTNALNIRAVAALKTERFRSIIQNLKTIKYEFSFIDAATNRQVFVLPEEVKVKKNNKNTSLKLQKTKDGHLSCTLPLRTDFEFCITKNGYESKIYKFKTSPQTNKTKTPLNRTIVLSREQPEAPVEDNTFQLIGVISKTIQPYPNPIKLADYI